MFRCVREGDEKDHEEDESEKEANFIKSTY